MEYSSSYTSSSSSSYPRKAKSSKSSSSSFVSSLHAVHKHSFKPIKMPIAPMPRIPPKIYKVEARNFKEVVQRLTGAPKNQLRRLKEVAPPPLNLSPITCLNIDIAVKQPQPRDANNRQTHADHFNDSMAETFERDRNQRKLSDTFGAFSPLAFTFSPSSQAWFSSLLFSPGSLSFLEQTTVP